MTTLNNRLLEAMQDANLTKTDLWKGCGLSSGAITHWFNGSTHTLKGESLLNASRVLKVNPSWLATGEGLKAPPEPHPLDAYKETFNNLCDADREFALDILEALKRRNNISEGK